MSFRRFLYTSRFPAERGRACFPMGIRPRHGAENAQAGLKDAQARTKNAQAGTKDAQVGDNERPSGGAESREKAKNDDAWRKTARGLPGARRENAIHLTEDAGMTVDRHGKHGMTTKRRGKITDAKHKNVPGAGIFTKSPKR